MNTIILSLTTYSWINNCFGTIIRNKKNIKLVILYDDIFPSYQYPRLCEDALYVQRKADLFSICKELGIIKAYNIAFDNKSEDVERLIAMLNLDIIVGGIKTIIYEYEPTIKDIIISMKKRLDFDIYTYSKNIIDVKNMDRIDLTLGEEEIRFKNDIVRSHVIAPHGIEDLLSSRTEHMYRG